MKASVLFARFPYGRSEDPDTTDWLVKTVLKCSKDPRIGEVHHTYIDDTPITASRNRVLRQAKERGIDLVAMVDADMSPDLPYPGAKPFWDTSLDFLLNHAGPCVIAAPYCGPPPHENVYIFRWTDLESDNPHPKRYQLNQYTRAEAAERSGIERVAALPTGLILIDMRIAEVLKPEYFYYEWRDEYKDHRDSTEDVVFTRDCDLAGIPVYCNWDAWAGHWKRKKVGKPGLVSNEIVRKEFRDALVHGAPSQERLLFLNGNGTPPETEIVLRGPARVGVPRIGVKS